MTRAAVLLVVCLAFAAGCSTSSQSQGYEKSDFSKRPPPAGYGPPGGAGAKPPAASPGG